MSNTITEAAAMKLIASIEQETMTWTPSIYGNSWTVTGTDGEGRSVTVVHFTDTGDYLGTAA